MAVSIAGLLWQAVSAIRECRGGAASFGAAVSSWAVTVEFLVSAIDYDECLNLGASL